MDSMKPTNKIRSLVGGVIRVISFNTDSLCYFMFSLSMTMNANVLALVYPLAAFGYGNLVYPLPKRMFWNLAMIYTILMLLVKVSNVSCTLCLSTSNLCSSFFASLCFAYARMALST